MMDCLIPQKLHQFTTMTEKIFKHRFSRYTRDGVGLEREEGTARLVGIGYHVRVEMHQADCRSTRCQSA